MQWLLRSSGGGTNQRASTQRRAGPDFKPTYIGVAFLAVLLIFCLVKAYRVWEEIHDVEEPSSPDDLLESFEQAHLAGELDDDEFERVAHG